MYRIDFGRGTNKQSKYFITMGAAVQFCTLFGWSVKRIKSVH